MLRRHKISGTPYYKRRHPVNVLLQDKFIDSNFYFVKVKKDNSPVFKCKKCGREIIYPGIYPHFSACKGNIHVKSKTR